MLVETGEQIVDGTSTDQAFAEQPDRLGVRHLLRQGKAQKPHERQPVLNDKFGLIIGEIVERLQHHDLEHQHRWKRRTPTLRSVGSLQRFGQRLLKTDHGMMLFSFSSGSPTALNR